MSEVIILEHPEEWATELEQAVDGGFSPSRGHERGELRFTDFDLMTASPAELLMLNHFQAWVEPLSNQYYRFEEDLMSRDTVLHWKYITPSITNLKE